MKTTERIQSVIDSHNQIKKQQADGHYCIHTAYIGRGKNMKISGFCDYTLLHDVDKFLKIIKEEPRSNVYVEINYYVDSSRLSVWRVVTWDDYLLLPKEWKEFKKLIKK